MWCSFHDRLRKTLETNRDGSGLDACAIQHIAQADTGPPCISHRPVLPLRAGHARLEHPAGIARALIDRGQIDSGHRHDIRHRERERLVDVTTDDHSEGGNIHLFWNACPVPAHIKLVVRGEYVTVEYLERCLEQWWPGTLQNHLPLLREGRRQVALFGASRQQIKIDEVGGPGWERRQRTAHDGHSLNETTTTEHRNDLCADGHDKMKRGVVLLRDLARPGNYAWRRVRLTSNTCNSKVLSGSGQSDQQAPVFALVKAFGQAPTTHLRTGPRCRHHERQDQEIHSR